MGFYLGIFLTAFATLALEVTLTRLLSVTTWYHLAFFAVSIALLGMTAGATTVYLKPKWFSRDSLRSSMSKACLAYAVAVPVTLLVLCVTPIDVTTSARGYLLLLVASLASLVPFYFSGIVISAIITKSPLPIGKLYASDLAGASLGCIFVLRGLEILSAPTLILLCGCVGVAAGQVFLSDQPVRRLRSWSLIVLGILAALVMMDLVSPYGIRPLVVKGKPVDPEKYIFEDWNSFSRVVVYAMKETRPQYWGRSMMAPPDEKVFQHKMNIDGSAGTFLRRFQTIEDIQHLRYDVTNIVYYLRPQGGAFIIGVGGGRDIQSAILFGQERILGIDINPIFLDLLQNRFREFAGIADRPEVTLVADEARSYISRSKDRYSVIQMSLTDTWAATGAGAFVLSENTLYTIEAWKTFMEHLSEDGIFTVSRWHNPRDLGETGRLVSLGVATLLDLGIQQPAAHLAMVTSGGIATLLVSKEPLSKPDLGRLSQVCEDLRFKLVLCPGQRSNNLILERIISAQTRQQLAEATADSPLNYTPPTDESPYFFSMLRPNQVLPAFLSEPRAISGPVRSVTDGVSYGNIIATRTLLGLIVALLVLAFVAIVFPLVVGAGVGGRSPPGSLLFWPAAAYFSLIGAGFMFAEIALIQRLSVFLGHPIYALGVLLFTVIASAGLGSLVSEKLPLTRRPWVFVYPVVIASAILGIRFILPLLGSHMISSSMAAKILASILTVAPLGLLLGLAFPTGMRLVSLARASQTPWYWALNGIFGVLCSALTVFVSIYFGISTSLYVATACYALLLFCLPSMLKIYREGAKH